MLLVPVGALQRGGGKPRLHQMTSATISSVICITKPVREGQVTYTASASKVWSNRTESTNNNGKHNPGIESTTVQLTNRFSHMQTHYPNSSRISLFTGMEGRMQSVS